VHDAPGIPCALLFKGRPSIGKTRLRLRCGNAGCWVPVFLTFLTFEYWRCTSFLLPISWVPRCSGSRTKYVHRYFPKEALGRGKEPT